MLSSLADLAKLYVVKGCGRELLWDTWASLGRLLDAFFLRVS